MSSFISLGSIMVKVLVVDDDRDIREAVADVLASAGHAVRTALDGQDALAQLRQDVADVVLLDLAMPVMDGVSFLNAVRSDPLLAPIRVVVATASSVAAPGGIVSCLRKPFEVHELLQEISRAAAAEHAPGLAESPAHSGHRSPA